MGLFSKLYTFGVFQFQLNKALEVMGLSTPSKAESGVMYL
jgi:hypothetical protein